MNEENKQIIILECSASYSLSDDTGLITAKDDVRVRLGEDNLSVLPKFGEPLFLALRDILEISEDDYKIHLNLTSKEKLTIFNLGYKYEDFLRILSRLRNEILLKDMLMQETLRKSGVESEFVHFEENGQELQKGKCEPRLYETALVIIPEKGELIRIPYSDILEIQVEDFQLAITTDFGEKLVFSRMGKHFDPFTKTLSDLMNELSLKVQSSLKELLPEADPSVIRRVARFMKEGKAAKRSDLESISPDLWVELEKKLEAAGIKEEYDFLKSLSQKEKMCIGLKRGLLGDLTGEYIWFLIPVYSTNPQQPGNAVAMEAISGEGRGKATYFFRIVSRKDYPNFKSIDELHREADNFIKRINRCMLAINFRREPIYLPDERLEEPQYQKYKFAIAKIPALRQLRQLFIGRVIHSSPEQWKNDVMDLLKFNVSTMDDAVRRTKGETVDTGYVTTLDFNPQSLKDITDTSEGDALFSENPIEGILLPESRVRITFNTFCMDEGKPAPDFTIPYIFSYEMLDMPMYLKVLRYLAEKPEIEQSLAQNLLWKLSKKPKFEELTKQEQDLLFDIDPYADAEVNNYVTQKHDPWQGYPPEIWPDEIVPQPIPNTELFGKIVRMKGFSEAEVEIYNPTKSPQKLLLIKSNPGGFSAKFFDGMRQRIGFRNKFNVKGPTSSTSIRG